MRRLLKSWVFWLFIVLPLVPTLAYFTHQVRKRDRCPDCESQQTRSRWYLGFWMTSVPLTSESAVVAPSHLAQDGWIPDHAHRWIFQQGSPYYLFGTSWGGCAIGGERPNEFSQSYEKIPGFRELLKAKRARGELSDAEVVEMVRAPRDAFSSTPGTPREAALKARLETWWKECQTVAKP